jgi:hypothetical protein
LVVQVPDLAAAAFVSFVQTGCVPGTSGSTTTGTFACTAMIRTANGEGEFIYQPTATVGSLSGGDGTYWIALHRDTTTTVSGWTRQAATHYLWQKSATFPSTPTDGFIVARVEVAGGAVTKPSLAGNYAPRSSDRDLDARTYGVHCDNGHDDTAALQRAFAAATPGTTVVLPVGKCLVSGTLAWQGSGINLRGQGVSQRNDGQHGTWIVATVALSPALFYSGALVNSTISDLGFDGAGSAAAVVALEYYTGRINQVRFRNVIFEGATPTTGHLVRLGGATNSEVDWVEFEYCTFWGDSTNSATRVRAAIYSKNTNTQQNSVRFSNIYGADYGLELATGAQINAYYNIFGVITNAAIFGTVYGDIVGNYTEDQDMTSFLLIPDLDLTNAPPLYIARNILNMAAGHVPLNVVLCYPMTVADNKFTSPNAISLGTSLGTCGDYRVTAINNTFHEGTFTACGSGWTGTASDNVDEINTAYYNGSGAAVMCKRFLGGVRFGGGAAVIVIDSAYSVQTIAAPETIPGCSDSTNISLNIAALSSTQPLRFLHASLQDKVLPGDGQLSVHTTGSGTVKIRWCQFAGTAASPDGGENGTYVVWGLATQP